MLSFGRYLFFAPMAQGSLREMQNESVGLCSHRSLNELNQYLLLQNPVWGYPTSV